MTKNYRNAEVVVDSGKCYKHFSDGESIGSYLVVGCTFASPLMSVMPLGFDSEVVTSALVSNNACGYSSTGMNAL